VSLRLARKRGEEGATLILVIGFMVMVGLISAGLATQLASSSSTRIALDKSRNREYAADGAILTNIARVRDNIVNHGQAVPPSDPCGSKVVRTLNGVTVQVDCTYTRSLTLSGFLQRDATFVACELQSGGGACPGSAVIIRAQVNYASQNPPGDASVQVSKTYIQTWSVNS
jgi:hypothetical protein